jgi:hypothetical protein
MGVLPNHRCGFAPAGRRIKFATGLVERALGPDLIHPSVSGLDRLP